MLISSVLREAFYEEPNDDRITLGLAMVGLQETFFIFGFWIWISDFVIWDLTWKRALNPRRYPILLRPIEKKK